MGVMGPTRAASSTACPTVRTEAFLTAEDFEVFVRAFERTGFTGGLNWYRNFDRNWETTAYLAGAKVMQPALMLTAELDPVLRPEMADGNVDVGAEPARHDAHQGLGALDAAGKAGRGEPAR